MTRELSRELLPAFPPKQPRQMPCAVDHVEDANRIKHKLGRIRIISRNMSIDARQIILNDCRMPFGPQASLRLAAAVRTRSFQSGSSGANGPAIRSRSRCSNVPAAQSDSTRLNRYSSVDRAPEVFARSASTASSGSGTWMVSADMR